MDPRTERTHELLCRDGPELRVVADDRLLAVVCDDGDEAVVAIDPAGDSRLRAALDTSLTRVSDPDSVVGVDRPAWRASLPAEAEALQRALEVDPETAGDWGRLGANCWRLWEVHTLVVRRGDDWLYYSVPHEASHWLRADRGSDLVSRADEALSDLPCVVVPVDPLVEWD